MSKNNSKKESNVKNKSQARARMRRRKKQRFCKIIKRYNKALFNLVVDLFQQEQCKNCNQ
ncbi:MAG: hypothetical protein ACR5KW_00355 [Wolbachia sp.]